MSLIAKMTLAISLLLLLGIAPYSYLHIRAMKQLLHEEAVTKADSISETILKTTHYQMLENNRTRVYQMVQEAGSQQGIEHIRMITKDGRIIFSTEPEEIGGYLDKTASACDMCHAGEKPLREVSSMSRSRVFRGPDGTEVLGITKAIYNQRSCYTAACHAHPEDQDILGVLDTIVSLDTMRTQVLQYTQWSLLLTVGMLLATAVSLTVLVQKFVNRPLLELLRHTKLVGNLKFGGTIAVSSNDEIGSLARAFNVMTERLQTAKQELEDWGNTLEIKVQERTCELQRMQAQLIRSEKLASLGEIVAGIAHELNNPLTGILVMASLLEKNPRLDPDAREDLATVVHESKRCARIVKGLLDFSRVTTPQKAPTDLNHVMENSLSLIGTQSIFHNVRIEKLYDPQLPTLLLDGHQMEQVFVNILLNAGQAMTEGGTLTLRTAREGSQVRIDVEDTGHGIAEGLLGKIFDPFYTTKETTGTGLGLSVSYGIVENHGGSIEVQSQVGRGTCFTIRLPLGAEAEAEGDTHPAAA